MKKMINTAFIYFIFSMLAGVFYREFTKFFAFFGKTSLASIHTHLMSMGVLLFLILALFCGQINLESDKSFKKFFMLYNIAFPIMIIIMLVRGVEQVLNTEFVRALDASISGISGLSHIIIAVSFVYLFMALKQNAKN